MSDDDFEETKQFTEETRRRLEVTGRALADAVLTHSTKVAAAIGHADVKAIFASNEELAAAALAYGNAHFDHCGVFPSLDPFTWDEDEHDDEDPEDEDELVSGQGITVVRRVDFIAHDVDALIEAGRVAYLIAWPDDTRRDAEADVEDIGRAIYQISHAGGFDALLDADGLAPTAGITVIHSQENVLDAVALDAAVDTLDARGPWPIFSSEGAVLTSSSDLW